MTVSKPETVEANQADRDLVFSLMSPAARNEIEKLALEYIRDGRGDDAEAVQAVARHRLNATPSRQDGLREALDFIDKFFEPWGAWKTVWWEGEVSDDAAFSDGNALKHVANILRRAALSDTPPPDNERVTRSFQVHRELMDAPRTAWPDWLHNRVAVLGYGDQGFRVCAQPGGADIGNGDWGAFIVERHDGTLAVLSAFNNGGK